ncbi:ABC transporter ATP-binding protein [Oceanobacillus oncorhynchi subsp. incaldanensis]|uniref:Putative ABC transporter ATP-binding protein YxlF n=1 Tax=Oceanobacillus oncorhynchi TaxID=545501 RepID=A0A0A1MDA4_9BACI|nr:ABC transporter ATP-binding protein [Oceanobacillus oncorhynchi]GIO21061.1 ABC transporter ATP-binding protein [Oceanobacillus oncorhynchi subsp. incaldanensis]CEI83305.1 putative ABC transporter ATP-binding protein YxlF [Oceanobacillus oncorhynchi]
MEKPAMKLIDLKKTIGKNEIIKGLNFEIKSGEVFGFIGPNGAGKTTTIRMMVGLIKMSGGDVQILGKSIKNDYKEAIKEVGAIVENPEMYPFMTGMQNLIHFARMLPNVSKERIQEVISLVGLEKAIKEKVGKYSLGMRQRLGIAQALLHNPSVLILDEPTNGLDPAGIGEIRYYIRRLAEEQNVAVIISSHLLSEIELMCDRIGIIKNGELITIQNVHDAADTEQDSHQIQMEVTPAEKAMELLSTEYEIEAVLKSDLISFQSQREEIPNIIQTFVRNDISIYQVEVSRATLEEKFFDLIGENVIE